MRVVSVSILAGRRDGADSVFGCDLLLVFVVMGVWRLTAYAGFDRGLQVLQVFGL